MITDHRRTIDDGLYYTTGHDGERVHTGQYVFVAYDGQYLGVFDVTDLRLYERVDLGALTDGQIARYAQELVNEYDSEIQE